MDILMIREAQREDLQDFLELLTFLHDNSIPDNETRIGNIWTKIINNRDHHLLLGHIGNKLVSSCVIVVIDNLTREQKPYAVIENVVTHPEYRNRGYASAILSAAKDIAIKDGCYKIMLMTGSKQESTLNFYRRAGYNSDDKTAFIQWLK